MAPGKNLAFLKSIKIEEYILLDVSLFFLIWLIFLGFPFINPQYLLKSGWINIKAGANWWGMGIIAIIFLYIFIRLYVFFIKIASKGISFRDFLNKRVKFKPKYIWFLFRPLIPVFIASGVGLSMVSILQQEVKYRLVNLPLLNIDKIISAKYLLFWLNSLSNPLKDFLDFITPAVTSSFLLLGLIMGVVLFVFYLDKNKKLFKGYVMSIFIVLALATPLWYFFPATSPVNAFLHNIENIPTTNFALSQAIQNYQPNFKVRAFQEKMWEEQKNSPPVTTMPSMHWAWAGIIVYYLFKKSKKTLFFSLPWLILALFGTVYLGCHYLIDGLVAIPLTVLSIFLANSLIKIEKKYYKESWQETQFKENVSRGFWKPFQEIKCMFKNNL